MNIYNAPMQNLRHMNPGQLRKGMFRNDLETFDFNVAAELHSLYKECKEKKMIVLQLDILKTMAGFLYPKPNLNITVTSGETDPIPTELENKSSAELQALLPQAVNE